ncbi:MAG TPA: hypothetical protein VFS76_03200 [Pyrinomonadaceae bacterium]|nr:hypothetical protein [Pyrinomonadaceae bacterium]
MRTFLLTLFNHAINIVRINIVRLSRSVMGDRVVMVHLGMVHC